MDKFNILNDRYWAIIIMENLIYIQRVIGWVASVWKKKCVIIIEQKKKYKQAVTYSWACFSSTIICFGMLIVDTHKHTQTESENETFF